MDFNRLFYETIRTDINMLDEYVSGQMEIKVFNVLKDNGFNCDSTAEEINDFLSATSKILKSRDIEEIASKFFLDKNCQPHFLQKLFGGKKR